MLQDTCGLKAHKDAEAHTLPIRKAETIDDALVLAGGDEAHIVSLFNQKYVIAAQAGARKVLGKEGPEAAGAYLMAYEYSGKRAAAPKKPREVKVPTDEVKVSKADRERLKAIMAEQGVSMEFVGE